MTSDPTPPARKPRLPWWRTNRSQVAVLALIVLGLVLANSLLKWLGWGVWVVALLAFSVWLAIPDLAWAWREHPEAVRRVIRVGTHPRTIRVLLYALLAYAWYVTMF